MTSQCVGNCTNCEECEDFNLEDFGRSFDNESHKYGYCPVCYSKNIRKWISSDRECGITGALGKTHYPFLNEKNSIDTLKLNWKL